MEPTQQQTDVGPVNDQRSKHQRMIDSLAKARAAKVAKKALASYGLETPPAKSKRRKRTAKTRLDEAIVQHKAAKKGPPAGWLDGIHHMPNGCPDSCRAGVCIITGENVCAHPDTNLQAKYMAGGHMEVIDRFQAAKLELRRLDAEKSLKK